jgi:hypothetical protein
LLPPSLGRWTVEQTTSLLTQFLHGIRSEPLPPSLQGACEVPEVFSLKLSPLNSGVAELAFYAQSTRKRKISFLVPGSHFLPCSVLSHFGMWNVLNLDDN